jgi:hypothetical protein
MALIDNLKELKTFLVLKFLIFMALGVHHFYFSNYIENYYEINFVVYTFLLSMILLLFVFIVGKIFARSSYSGVSFRENYLITSKINEYEQETEEITAREKEKLFSNPEFISMMQEKGFDESKWNWQLNDRIEGKMKVISDDELSDLTVSNDEEF